jgi:oxamate amidohydrolase
MSPTDGVVATPHHLATRAGQRAFAQGGTAVDAALAAAAVLTVVYPHMCAIGGDAQALLALPGGRVQALSGSGAAARAADASLLRGEHSTMPIHGVHPITVPGLVAAWGDLHAAGGRLPWSALFADALALAEQGAPVAAALGRDLAALHPRLGTDPGLRAVFFRTDGRVLQTGDTLRQPALARSLRLLSNEGARTFYHGTLAERLVAGLRRLGSPLQPEDFAAHRSRWLQPLSTHFGGWQVLSNPPVAQGHVLMQLLQALQQLGLERADPLGPAAPTLARLCALTAAQRDTVLGDPEREPVDVAALLSAQRIKALVEQARDTSRALSPLQARPRPDGDTVAIVAQDAQGHAVTLIQSIFHAFGSGVLEPDTGIVCQNRGAAFTLDDGPARLVGGTRPPSTLTPSMLRRDGRLEIALGAMGGKSQPQILMQLLMRLAAGTAPADALAAPRWVVGTFGVGDETVALVEGAASADARAHLAASGLPVVVGADRDDRAGHAQFVRHRAGQALDSATDPRADGLAH